MSKWLKTSAGKRQEPDVSTSADVVVWRECTMNRVSDGDRSTSLSFVSCGASQGYAPQSGEIIGILTVLFRYVGIGTRLVRTSMGWLTVREFVILVPDPIAFAPGPGEPCDICHHTSSRPPFAGLLVTPRNKDDMGDGVPTDQLSNSHCKRVVQDLPQLEKLSYSFSESHWCTESTCQELIEWLGSWVRKQGFLHWMLLWDCASVHRKASLLEWIRTAHPECHVLFIPGGYTAELQPADIAIQQPLKHSIKLQAMQFFAESLCRDEAVLDLRLNTMKRLMAHWVLHASAEVEKNTSITTKAWRHLSWTFEEAPWLAARATREHLDGTLFDETEAEQDEPPEEEDLILHDDNDDDDAEDPESTGTAVAEASEPFPTVAAEVARAERFLYLRCAYGEHPPKP